MAETTGRRSRPLLRILFGEVLRRHRREQGRTLAEVARDASVSVQYLSEVERGRKEPSSEILAAICDSLRIELADLLAEVGRDLVTERAPAPVFRLETARLRRRAASPARHAGDVMLLAA
jgi:transcriptional regulator with XRE-family HTH domain